ncbi:uncharacterized protein BDV17DRAFT_264407 [Aspergillus undulatus]|uniref:uncharacterized protein n=1 Tax=Aspergillus undulatus TaxID=1810928 RepID=UPI003CCDC41E
MTASKRTHSTYATVTPLIWLYSEIPIAVVSVSLPSIFFLIRQGLAQGRSASIDSNSTSSSARLVNSRTGHQARA